MYVSSMSSNQVQRVDHQELLFSFSSCTSFEIDDDDAESGGVMGSCFFCSESEVPGRRPLIGSELTAFRSGDEEPERGCAAFARIDAGGGFLDGREGCFGICASGSSVVLMTTYPEENDRSWSPLLDEDFFLRIEVGGSDE